MTALFTTSTAARTRPLAPHGAPTAHRRPGVLVTGPTPVSDQRRAQSRSARVDMHPRVKELWRKAHVPFQPVRSSHVLLGGTGRLAEEVLRGPRSGTPVLVARSLRRPVPTKGDLPRPVTGQLTVSLSAEGEAVTRVPCNRHGRAQHLHLVSIPEVTILARFAQAIGAGDERRPCHYGPARAAGERQKPTSGKREDKT